MVTGPAFAPPEYSWISHTTSQQAGQQTPGAWVMRAGFLGYGAGTLVASALCLQQRSFVRLALMVFGSGLIGTAIWSNASILPGIASGMQEDWLHSIASGLVGTAFATACVASIVAPGGSRRDLLAWLGLVASITIPIAMQAFPEVRGLSQRVMTTFRGAWP